MPTLHVFRGSRHESEVINQGNRRFQCRVGPARFERRPTIRKRRELMVGLRGETPLVPPYILPSFKKAFG